METVKIEGLREMREALTRVIPAEMQGKALQKALAAGTKLTVAAARAKAPRLTGRLARAIYAARDKASKFSLESRIVGVRRGKKAQKTDKDAFYWKFVEFGHKAGKTQVPPNPFMRPAFESTKVAAAEAITAKLKQILDAAARKAKW
jgi:HK97 gp10 family phage protein